MQRRVAFLIVLFLSLFASRARGVEGGALVVTVGDAETPGERPPAPLPGATVRISTDQAMNDGRYGARRAVADSQGHAVFYGLPSDDYWLEVSLDGFQSRRFFVDTHAHVTRRVTVEIGVTYRWCTLGELWDLRGFPDPGVSGTTTQFSLASSRRTNPTGRAADRQ